MHQIRSVIEILKTNGITVGMNDVHAVNLGDAIEFRCYVPVSGVTTTKGKELVGIVRLDLVKKSYTFTKS